MHVNLVYEYIGVCANNLEILEWRWPACLTRTIELFLNLLYV